MRVTSAPSIENAREPPLITQIASAARRVPALADRRIYADEHIELEISLGVQYNNTFYPGIRPCDWREIERLCTSQSASSSSSDYWYSNVDGILNAYGLVPRMTQFDNRNTPRLRVTTKGDAVSRCELKVPCDVHTFGVKNGYDVRLHINCEKDMSILAAHLPAPPGGWTCRRIKTRTVTRLQAAPDWELHMTIVMLDDALVYEVEFEYSPAREPPVTLHARCDEIANSIAALMRTVVMPLNCIRGRARMLGPAVLPHILADMPLANNEHATTVERIMSRCTQYPKKLFVGAMPRDITREHLALLRADAENVYAVEKTDGVRVILIISTRGVFTLDRNNTISVIDERWPDFVREMCHASICGKGPTVLDGELTKRAGTADDYTFVVFDILMNNGCPMYTTAFEEKVACMRKTVTGPVYEAAARLGHRLRPFDVRCKRYVPLQRAVLLMNRIVGDRLFQYDKSHVFAIDGFVLVHASGTDVKHYKWKPASHVTVDFIPVSIGNGRLRLEADMDGARTLPVAEIQLSASEWNTMVRVQLDSELATRMQPPSIQSSQLPVVECRYDADAATWRVVSFRTDKSRANHASVLISTVLGMINPIQEAELFRLGN